MPVWRAEGYCSRQLSPALVGSLSRIRSFALGVVGPEAARQCVLSRCTLVPRVERKSGSEPKTKSHHPFLFPWGLVFEWNSVWRQQEVDPIWRAFCIQPGQWRLRKDRNGISQGQGFGCVTHGTEPHRGNWVRISLDSGPVYPLELKLTFPGSCPCSYPLTSVL